MSKNRTWCFTINNYTSEDEEQVAVLSEKARYLIVGREGKDATPHLQGYVVFKSQRTLRAVSKDLPRAHLLIAKGSSLENRNYCSKEGDFHEVGDRPLAPSEKGQMEKDRFEKAWELAKEGKIEEIDADIRLRYLNTLEKIPLKYGPRPTPNPTLENRWIWGPTGSGKSRGAALLYPGAYYKMCNKWWDGYKGEETVIIEDLDVKHNHLAHHLKIWGDHNPFIAEMKGSATMIRPKRIIVTSNYPPEGIWEGEPSTLEPLQRRYAVEYKD